MKRYIAALLSVVGGWLIASVLVASLTVAGFDVAASMATNWQQYSTYQGGEILLLTIVLGWALYQVIGRTLLGFEADKRPFVERLPEWVRHPRPVGLVITWIAAVFTFVLYPVAAYMSWRYYTAWRAEARTCPRCAERVKAAALVCRYCGQAFEATEPEPSQPLTVESEPISTTPAPEARTHRDPVGIGRWVAAGLVVVAVVAVVGLTLFGRQIRITKPSNAAPAVVEPSAAPPPCVLIAKGPQGRMEAYVPGATVAQCQSELAAIRLEFGPDSATSQLYVSTIRPLGTPACVVAGAQVFTYGPAAADLASRLCSGTGS